MDCIKITKRIILKIRDKFSNSHNYFVQLLWMRSNVQKKKCVGNETDMMHVQVTCYIYMHNINKKVFHVLCAP